MNDIKSVSIVALATILAAIIPLAVKQDRDIERLATEKERYRHELERASQQIQSTTTSLKRSEAGLTQMRARYTDLEVKYQRSIGSGRRTYKVSILDVAPHKESIATGESIDFEMSSSSLLIHFVKVTRDGPVFRVMGCAKPGILSATLSPRHGENAYSIARGQALEITASSRCCELGLGTCDISDLEEFALECIDYNVDEQKSTITFKRSLASGG